jgi:hypothetical protein
MPPSILQKTVMWKVSVNYIQIQSLAILCAASRLFTVMEGEEKNSIILAKSCCLDDIKYKGILWRQDPYIKSTCRCCRPMCKCQVDRDITTEIYWSFAISSICLWYRQYESARVFLAIYTSGEFVPCHWMHITQRHFLCVTGCQVVLDYVR